MYFEKLYKSILLPKTILNTLLLFDLLIYILLVAILLSKHNWYKKSYVPKISILLVFSVTQRLPSPSKYPLIKCLINSFGTLSSVGNFNVKDFWGVHPKFIKSFLTFSSLIDNLLLYELVDILQSVFKNVLN